MSRSSLAHLLRALAMSSALVISMIKAKLKKQQRVEQLQDVAPACKVILQSGRVRA